MSTDLVFQEAGVTETRQERALRRAQELHNAFQSAFEVLAEIYRDEDWRWINDVAGRPYTGFTAFVQDQLGCAASNARRYQQGIVGLVLPLQEVALPGARIPVTSSDVVRLGVAGARVVVEEAPAVLEGVTERDDQTDALRDLIDSVAKRSTDPGFGPVRESAVPDSPLGTLVPSSIPDTPAFDPQPSASSSPGPDGDESIDDDGLDDVDNDGLDDRPAWSSESPRAPLSAASHPPAPAGTGPESASVPAPSPPEHAPASAAAGVAPTDQAPPDQAMADLEAAITAVLAAGDPTALAERLSRGHGAALAPRCLASGQLLVRLGQLLRTLS